MSATQSSLGFLGNVSDPLPRVRPQDVGLSPERLARIGEVLNADIAAGKCRARCWRSRGAASSPFSKPTACATRRRGVAMTADSLFNIASMTKPVTAVAALQLYEQGRLLIDDPLSKYFPKFARHARRGAGRQAEDRRYRPAARPITLHDLMRHTSGLIYGGRGTTPVHKLYPEGSGVAGAAMTGGNFSTA